MLEILAYILAPFIASGAIYYLAKPILDSIWNVYLGWLGKSGALGEPEIQVLVAEMMKKGF